MEAQETNGSRSRGTRASSNRSAYLKSLAQQDQVLLRLDKGGAALMDRCARSAGLSRAAFARMLLPPLLEAVGSRLGELERARGAQSLAQFLTRAVDGAILRASEETPTPCSPTADEFDKLFG